MQPQSSLADEGVLPSRQVILSDGDEQVDRTFFGSIRCRKLTLTSSAIVIGDILVDEIALEEGAYVEGAVMAGKVRIHERAHFVGELGADEIISRGHVRGLVIAGSVRASAAAVFAGVVFADKYGSEVGAQVLGTLQAFPGSTARSPEIIAFMRDQIVRGGVAPASSMFRQAVFDALMANQDPIAVAAPQDQVVVASRTAPNVEVQPRVVPESASNSFRQDLPLIDDANVDPGFGSYLRPRLI